MEAAYDDAPAERRHRPARLLASGGRTALAERPVARLSAEWGDAEAARRSPRGSCPGRRTPSTAGENSPAARASAP
ncbi:hypothetical protein Scel_15330 [Streptomyces cellostaticus]|nr:hypothetical protein Scel_15330 [Streptomyces cellostaticus]